MIIKTYQSEAVLKILQQGRTYHAHRNLRLQAAYQGLIHLLGLHCEAPVFGYLRGHKGCTNGKISGSILLTLKVPADCVWLTEYSVWADYMYCVLHYASQNYTHLLPNEEFTARQFHDLQIQQKTQRSPSNYQVPQAILEKIKPEWLVSYIDCRRLPPLRRFLLKLLHR